MLRAGLPAAPVRYIWRCCRARLPLSRALSSRWQAKKEMMEPSMSRSAAAGAGGEPNPDAEPIEGALQRAGLQVWQQALQLSLIHI